MKPSDFVHEIALPLITPAVLFAMILFYVLYEIALLGRMFGVVIALLLAAQLIVFVLPAQMRYLMVVLEARAFGRTPVPLELDLLSWVGNSWSLFPLVHIVAFVYAVYLAGSVWGGSAALAFALCYAALLPASLVVLAMTHSPFASLNPAAMIKLVRRCGVTYLLGPVFLAAATWLVVWLNVALNKDWLTELVSFYLIFAAFAVFGGMVRPLHLKQEIGIPMPAGLDEETDLERHLLQRTMVLNHAYGLVSRGNRAGGLEHLFEALQNDHDSDAGWAWFLEKMLLWENPEAALAFAQQYVHRLLRHGENVKAVKLMMRCCMVNPAFKPLPEDIELAATAAEHCHNAELASFLR